MKKHITKIMGVMLFALFTTVSLAVVPSLAVFEDIISDVKFTDSNMEHIRKYGGISGDVKDINVLRKIAEIKAKDIGGPGKAQLKLSVHYFSVGDDAEGMKWLEKVKDDIDFSLRAKAR